MMKGRTLIDNLVGATLVLRARDELVALYQTSGRAGEAQPILRSADPTTPAAIRPPERTLSAAEQDQVITKTIMDPGLPNGLRWEMTARYAAYEPCTQLRDIVFGPGEAYYARLAEARKALVHTPGDDALMRMVEQTLEVPGRDRTRPISIAARSLMGFARAVDALTGSKRMLACASIMD
jgi:hypothetical protein